MVSGSLTEEKPPFQSTFNGGVTLNMSDCFGPPFLKCEISISSASGAGDMFITCLYNVYNIFKAKPKHQSGN